jgi:hypothetical protein
MIARFARSTRLRVISYGVVANHLKLQQPRSKEGLDLLHAAKQTKTLLGKWFVWVLNPDGPPWCRLARALLTKHLAATGRVPSDLLAGSDWYRYQKEMASLWRSLLSAWDGMQGGMINCGKLSSSVGLALSASLVFIRTEDGKLCKTTDAWRRADINHTHDIIHRCAQGQQSYQRSGFDNPSTS